MTGPDYQHDTHDRLVLEAKERMKRRGLDSPDDGDALALTFAAPVRRGHLKVSGGGPDGALQACGPAM